MGLPVVHFQIGCRDRGKTADFFTRLFGGQSQAMGPATRINTAADSGIQGHITVLGQEPHHYTTFYGQGDDVQAISTRCGTGQQDCGSAGRNSDRNLRMVRRSRRKHDRVMEAEINGSQAGQIVSAVLLRICC